MLMQMMVASVHEAKEEGGWHAFALEGDHAFVPAR
jgi:hypothetical protein